MRIPQIDCRIIHAFSSHATKKDKRRALQSTCIFTAKGAEKHNACKVCVRDKEAYQLLSCEIMQHEQQAARTNLRKNII